MVWKLPFCKTLRIALVLQATGGLVKFGPQVRFTECPRQVQGPVLWSEIVFLCHSFITRRKKIGIYYFATLQEKEIPSRKKLLERCLFRRHICTFSLLVKFLWRKVLLEEAAVYDVLRYKWILLYSTIPAQLSVCLNLKTSTHIIHLNITDYSRQNA